MSTSLELSIQVGELLRFKVLIQVILEEVQKASLVSATENPKKGIPDIKVQYCCALHC